MYTKKCTATDFISAAVLLFNTVKFMLQVWEASSGISVL